MSDLMRRLDEVLREAGMVVKVGLRQQGHFDRVSAMRLEHATWNEIGKAIGWTGDAVQQMYEIESRLEVEALRAEVASLRGQTCATCRDWDRNSEAFNDGYCEREVSSPGYVDGCTDQAFGCNQWAARASARPEGGEQ